MGSTGDRWGTEWKMRERDKGEDRGHFFFFLLISTSQYSDLPAAIVRYRMEEEGKRQRGGQGTSEGQNGGKRERYRGEDRGQVRDRMDEEGKGQRGGQGTSEGQNGGRGKGTGGRTWDK